METRIYKILLVSMLLLPMNMQAQGWINIGSTINQNSKQETNTFKTHFNPDVELGLRLPFALFSGEADLSDYSDWDICCGMGASVCFRFIDIDHIDWVKKSNYKFLWDLYIGPSFYFPFSDNVTGLLINPFIGYSTSSAWFDPDITSGALSVKLSADLIISKFSIGVSWRPLKQHIEGESSKYEYLTFRSFDYSPSFAIRIGYFGMF